MGEIRHGDLWKLQQYYLSLHHELKKFEEQNPEFKNGSSIVKLSRKIVEVSTKIADVKVVEGARVSEPISRDSVFWALIVLIFLMFANGIYNGVMYIAIADLENCAYKGMCVEIPPKGE